MSSIKLFENIVKLHTELIRSSVTDFQSTARLSSFNKMSGLDVYSPFIEYHKLVIRDKDMVIWIDSTIKLFDNNSFESKTWNLSHSITFEENSFMYDKHIEDTCVLLDEKSNGLIIDLPLDRYWTFKPLLTGIIDKVRFALGMVQEIDNFKIDLSRIGSLLGNNYFVDMNSIKIDKIQAIPSYEPMGSRMNPRVNMSRSPSIEASFLLVTPNGDMINFEASFDYFIGSSGSLVLNRLNHSLVYEMKY